MATKITIETGRTAAKKGKVIHLKNEKDHTQIHTKTTKAVRKSMTVNIQLINREVLIIKKMRRPINLRRSQKILVPILFDLMSGNPSETL
jgi:hypothetical protein